MAESFTSKLLTLSKHIHSPTVIPWLDSFHGLNTIWIATAFAEIEISDNNDDIKYALLFLRDRLIPLCISSYRYFQSAYSIISTSHEDLDNEKILHSNLGVMKVAFELYSKRQFLLKEEVLKILKQLVRYSFYMSSRLFKTYVNPVSSSASFLQLLVVTSERIKLYSLARGSCIRVRVDDLPLENYMSHPLLSEKTFYPISCVVPSLVLDKLIFSLTTSLSNDDILEMLTNVYWTHGCWIEIMKYFSNIQIDASNSIMMQTMLVTNGSLTIPKNIISMEVEDGKNMLVEDIGVPYPAYFLQADEPSYSGQLVLTYRGDG